MDWKNLENSVKELCSCHWQADAISETINGVKCDCVVKKRNDYWIIVEISKETTLSKIRTDIGKFAGIRLYLFSQNIFCECYFVCPDPTDSMRVTGDGQHVTVLSIEELRGKLIGYSSYYNLRRDKPFGSAIDRYSGEQDSTEYVSVKYQSVDGKRFYTIEDLAELLCRGEKIILTGDYGTGKSRCVQETFFALHDNALAKWKFPIAINLRENWGVLRGHELIRRHFDDLGISEIGESAIRLFNNDRLILLIDGFDEIASQTWSSDPNVMKKIRRKSLASVSDLLNKVNCGVLITGREHYFNSSDEMFECLGLNLRSTYLLRCAREFSEVEIQSYLKRAHKIKSVPEWLPKRPLICQILSELDPPILDELLTKETGEIRFWTSAIQAICEREASIKSILDAKVINDVLIRTSRLTRKKQQNVGPLSISEINNIFTEVTGVPPNDETAVILQRLPLLGRVEAQTSDRQFVDHYFLDGLRGEDICREIFIQKEDILSESWVNPLQDFGVRLLSYEISCSPELSGFVRFLRSSCKGPNNILAADLACGILSAHDGTFDFDGINITDSHFSCIDLTNSNAKGFTITDSIINELIITGAHPQNTEIRNCIILKIEGVSEAAGLPRWICNNEVEDYGKINTVNRIKQARLSPEQKVFVTIIKKTFFQPGSGRMEEALLRGLGSPELKRPSEKILNRLCKEGILDVAPGRQGKLYIPQRTYTHRMAEILKELTLSKDPLWTSLRVEE